MPTTNETSLEKVFSDLAYSHLRDKSQGLLDYLLSFEMIKADEDGQRAVGVFGFEIDDDIYYAPVFFLNGEIRGLDSLYSPKSDLFVPLTEDWVNTVINKRTQTVGEPDTRSPQARGTRLPNYNRLKVIPGGGGGVNLKMGAARGVLNGELAYRTDVVDSLVDVVNGLGLGAHLKQALADEPRFQEAFSSFYSVFDIADPVVKAAEEAPSPVVVITSINDEGTSALSDAERRAVVEGGAAVIDNRPELAKSMLYETESKRILENPTGGGLYDVLYADGSVEPTVISTQGGGNGMVVVYRPSDKKHCTINERQVFTLRKYTADKFHDWLEKNAKKPSDIAPGTTAYFISREGAGTSAFCIDTVTTGVDGIKRLTTRDRYYMDASGAGCMTICSPGGSWTPRGNAGNANPNMFKELSWMDSVNRVPDVNGNVTEILVVERGAGHPKYSGDRLVVNDDQFFFIPVNTFSEETEGSTSPKDLYTNETYGKKRDNILLKINEFGDYNTVSEAMDKYAADLSVWRQGSDINVKIAGDVFTGDANATLKHLILDAGLGEEDARLVVKTANPTIETFKIHVVSKIAAELLNLPEVHDTQEGSYMNAFLPGQIPFGNVNQARSSDNRQFYRYNSPFGPGGSDSGDDSTTSDDTLNVMAEASRSGQKELFDSAALASLVKCYRPTEMVDRFLPTIVSGMDRLGRMLFLLYWHYDAFEDRYGSNDLAEFMDNLKSTYEQLGDIVIFLKKRTLAGDPEHYGIGMRASMDTSAEA